MDLVVSSPPSLLEAEHLHKSYTHSRTSPGYRVISDVSFRLEQGEILGLVGESGSGKSTIGKMLVGLTSITQGKARIAGNEVGEHSSRAETLRRRKDTQMVFQDPYSSLNPYQSIGRILAEPLEIHRLARGRAETRRQVAEILSMVGLREDFADRYPHELSGGQRQRIGIGRALAVRPRLLIADEPVSALDVSVQAQIVNLLCDLRDRLGLSILLIAHDLGVVRHMSDRIIVLYLGRIVEVCGTSELFSNPQHPYTRALLSAIPSLDPDAAIPAGTIKGELSVTDRLSEGCVFKNRCPFAMDACARTAPELEMRATGHSVACLRTDI